MLLSGSKDSTLKVIFLFVLFHTQIWRYSSILNLFPVVQIWDIGGRKLKHDLPGHADEVYINSLKANVSCLKMPIA